jgi:hypothetical protein
MEVFDLSVLRILILYLLLYSYTPQASALVPCNPYICPHSIVTLPQRMNGRCDLLCMHASCNFDSLDEIDATLHKENSDCLQTCLVSALNCTLSMLGDMMCDEGMIYIECNTQACGWDWGDCGFCSPSCTALDIKRNPLTCIEDCNTQSCYYQNGICVRNK